MKKSKVKPGHFLPTVARHRAFLSGFTEEDSDEIRFVTRDENGRVSEWHPISTYKNFGDPHEPIVYVDLVPLEYEE